MTSPFTTPVLFSVQLAGGGAGAGGALQPGALRPPAFSRPSPVSHASLHPSPPSTQAGLPVDLASPAGGPIPVDAASRSGDFYTPAAQRFDREEKALLEGSQKLGSLDPKAYSIIFVAGGHGAVADLASPAVGSFLAAAADSGAVVSAVCHGVIALLGAQEVLVRGRKLTGFSDAEEVAVGKVDAMGGPGKTLEARLKAAGASYSAGPDWAEHVVTDGKLVTGQNPASSAAVAAAAIKAAAEPLTPAVDAGCD